jgi:catechol 2,3-dioxygenase-like lactoylglutathione lyase family enzyme
MNRLIFFLAACFACLPITAEDRPMRPPITGIAHVRVYSTDLYKSREFYSRVLGLAPGTAGCMGMTRPCFTVNDRQQIELAQVSSAAPANLLAEVAFATLDVEQMHRYLLFHHISASAVAKDSNGFELRDAQGHAIAFVQLPSQRFFTAATEQIRTRVVHAGFIVKDLEAEDHFYRDLLGFRMNWHRGFKDADNNWWKIQVPDCRDWIEYMLNISPIADKQERGIQNQFSFAVEQIKPAIFRLHTHGLKSSDARETGRDGKWSFDICDPDLNRVEFMEFKPTQKPCCHPYTADHPKP